MPASDRQESFVCPGQSVAISRAVHLARLTRHDAACRECPHRGDRQGLSQRRADRLDWQPPRTTASGFFREGWSGWGFDRRQLAEIEQLAFRVGVLCRERASRDRSLAKALIGGEARGEGLACMAAAQRGLRLAGVEVVDLGPAAAAAMALAMLRLEASAGLLLATDPAERYRLTIRCWGSGGMPWSLPGQLAQLASSLPSRPPRPTRRFGRRHRHTIEQEYLAHLMADASGGANPALGMNGAPGADHVSRPEVRIAVASSCPTSLMWLQRLGPRLTFSVREVAFPGAGTETPSSAETHSAAEPPVTRLLAPAAADTRRPREETSDRSSRLLEAVRSVVVGEGCHFGAVIAHEGESLCCVDESGRPLPAAEVVALVVARRKVPSLAVRVAVGEGVSPHDVNRLHRAGAQIVQAGNTGESLALTAWRENTAYGLDALGRLWFRQPHGAGDALRGVLQIVRLLQTTGRPLSDHRRDLA